MDPQADEPPSPIDLAFDTDAPPEQAWAMLTEPRLVAEWFTDVTAVGRVGDPYRVDFGDGSVVNGVLTEVERGRRLAYTWTWADAEPHEETLVAWSIEARDGGGTSIRLIHDGWGDAGLDESVRNDHEGYWTGYLEDFAAVLAGAG